MGGFKDLKGMQFGKLEVIELHDRDKFGHCRWLCKCSCKGIHSDTIVQSSNLLRGLTTSCRKCNSYYEHEGGYMVGVTAKGEEFFFDREDFELVKQYVWHVHGDGYICNKGEKSIMMHRLIMNPPKGMDVDHTHGNRKDNRRSELRVCTRQQNLQNSRKRSGESSVYKGVYYNKATKSWASSIGNDYNKEVIGYFSTEEEAALAYNKRAVELFGEYAMLNVVKEE